MLLKWWAGTQNWVVKTFCKVPARFSRKKILYEKSIGFLLFYVCVKCSMLIYMVGQQNVCNKKLGRRDINSE